MLSSKIGHRLDTPVSLLIQYLFRGKINPTVFTLMGLALNGVAAVIIIKGEIRWGGLLILIAGLFDILDGVAARSSGKVSYFGGFLDSVIDRYSDMLILSSLIIRYSIEQNITHVVLVLAVSIGTILIPYARARAENFIPQCKVGLMERPERIIMLSIGAIFNIMPVVLWLMALLTNLTAFQRIHYTWKEVKKCR